MSMFLDPDDTDQVCRILQTYVQEWGKRNVVVTVPSDWQNYWTGNLGGVRLEFRRVNYLSIEIEGRTEICGLACSHDIRRHFGTQRKTHS